VKFNASKTLCLKFGSPRDDRERLYMDGEEVAWADRCLHLGNRIVAGRDMIDTDYALSCFYMDMLI